MPRTSKKRTWKAAANAYEKAKDLGPLVEVEPESLLFDGSPVAGAGRVYVTRTGQVFHPAWCSTIGSAWDENPDGVLVIAESAVGGRRECKSCQDPLRA